MTDQKKRLQRLAKLLALATSPNTHEANSARTKAEALMQAWGINEADVAEHEAASAIGSQTTDTGYKRTPAWVSTVYYGVQRYCGVRMVMHDNTFVMIGRALPIELAQYLVHAIVNQIGLHTRIYRDKKRRKPLKRSTLNSYRLGLAQGVALRLNMMVWEREHLPSSSAALVRLNDLDLADAWKDEHMTGLTQWNGYSGKGRHRNKGKRDADRINLNPGLSAPSHRRLT